MAPTFRIVRFDESEVVVKPRIGSAIAVPYREILTAEHLPQPWRGLQLHRRRYAPVRVRCWSSRRLAIEDELRRHGVRIVDEYGAMITPTSLDFEEELAKEPVRLRQSSDDA